MRLFQQLVSLPITSLLSCKNSPASRPASTQVYCFRHDCHCSPCPLMDRISSSSSFRAAVVPWNCELRAVSGPFIVSLAARAAAAEAAGFTVGGKSGATTAGRPWRRGNRGACGAAEAVGFTAGGESGLGGAATAGRPWSHGSPRRRSCRQYYSRRQRRRHGGRGSTAARLSRHRHGLQSDYKRPRSSHSFHRAPR